MTVRVECLTGPAVQAVLDDIARLRIQVFQDYPYLYDGDEDYERRYLKGFADSKYAIVVCAFDGSHLIGASTGAPLQDHAADFAAAFDDSGLELEDIFYCAESVLLQRYRGRGLGHAFFDEREAHARKLGFVKSAFCRVERAEDHPSRPADYTPLDAFWRKRGYEPLDGVVAEFSWRDLGALHETKKPLQFWIRDL